MPPVRLHFHSPCLPHNVYAIDVVTLAGRHWTPLRPLLRACGAPDTMIGHIKKAVAWTETLTTSRIELGLSGRGAVTLVSAEGVRQALTRARAVPGTETVEDWAEAILIPAMADDAALERSTVDHALPGASGRSLTRIERPRVFHYGDHPIRVVVAAEGEFVVAQDILAVTRVPSRAGAIYRSVAPSYLRRVKPSQIGSTHSGSAVLVSIAGLSQFLDRIERLAPEATPPLRAWLSREVLPNLAARPDAALRREENDPVLALHAELTAVTAERDRLRAALAAA